MDLQSIAITDEAIEMPIYDGAGTKTDASLQVIGQDSDEYKRKARSIYKTALKKAPKGDLNNLNEDDDESFSIKLRATHIKGWSGIQENGKDIPYSQENAEYIIKKYPFITDQLVEFVSARENFMKAS